MRIKWEQDENQMRINCEWTEKNWERVESELRKIEKLYESNELGMTFKWVENELRMNWKWAEIEFKLNKA